MTAHHLPPPAPDPCPLMQRYRALYLDNIGTPTPSATRRVKWARSLMDAHRRNCPACRPVYAVTNYNAQPPKLLVHYKPKEARR